MRGRAAAVAAFALIVTAAPAAVADPGNGPEVIFADTVEQEITFPFEFDPDPDDPDNPLVVDEGPCDFGGAAYSLSETVKVRETAIPDRDGETKWTSLHVNGTSTWTGPDGTAVTERWAWNGKRVETDSGLVFLESGNFWNVHQPGSGTGVILHEKGRHIVTVEFVDDGPPVVDFQIVGGPHDLADDGFGPLCEAIAGD